MSRYYFGHFLKQAFQSSEWIMSIDDVAKSRIRRLKHSVNTRSESICRDPDVVSELSRLHDNFVIILPTKHPIIILNVCKIHYVNILIEELGLHSLLGNPTYNLTDFSASEALGNHKAVLTSFGIQGNNEKPYKTIGLQRCTRIHIHIDSWRFQRSVRPSLYPFYSRNCLHIFKLGFQKYCKTAYSGSGINQMWNLKSPNFNLITSIKSYLIFRPFTQPFLTRNLKAG